MICALARLDIAITRKIVTAIPNVDIFILGIEVAPFLLWLGGFGKTAEFRISLK
jgi:hypothetical protein